MRIWSIIFGMVIFICVVTVSFSHTVALYERVGFIRWEAVLITIAVETTFLLSGWSILWYRYRGQHPGGPSYAGFLYGVTIVLFSNSAYTVGLDVLFTNKVAQWTLALSVVAGVFISEAIISRNLSQWTDRPATNHDKQSADRTERTAESTNQPANQADEPTIQVADHSTTNRPADQVAETANQPTGQSDRPATTSQDRPANKVADQVETSQPATKPNKVVDMADRRNNRPATKKTATGHPATDQESATWPTTGQPEKDQPANDQSTTNQKSTTNQSATGRPTTGADPEVVEVAERYFKENGELPSQRQLADMARCSRYKAAKAIDEVKEKYNLAV